MDRTQKLNIVLCAIALLLGVYLIIAANSFAALAMVLVILIIPVLSMVFGRVTSAGVRMSFNLQRACATGQPLALEVRVQRALPWRGRICLELECKNIITGEIERVQADLLPASGKVEQFTLAMNTACCGTIEVSLAHAFSYDPLGFAKTPINHVEFSSSYVVYPALVDMTVRARRATRADVLGAEYDRFKKGQDYTEVFDTREFREGDSLKHVHWKLSARMDDLVVREASRPADCDMALIVAVEVGNAENPEHVRVLNSTLSMAASISLSLLRQGAAHDVAYADGLMVACNTVEARSSFDAVLDTLMATRYPDHATDEQQLSLVESWLMSRVVAKTVFVTNFISEATFSKLAEFTDLTVVYVGPEAGIGAMVGDHYALVHVDAAQVDASVKSLEL